MLGCSNWEEMLLTRMFGSYTLADSACGWTSEGFWFVTEEFGALGLWCLYYNLVEHCLDHRFILYLGYLHIFLWVPLVVEHYFILVDLISDIGPYPPLTMICTEWFLPYHLSHHHRIH